MNKRIVKVLGLSTSIVIQILLALLAIFLIFSAAYVLGHGYLEGNSFNGNDSYSYFSVINWYSNFFPHVPYWFPNQGAGISFFAGYPYAPAYFVILLSRLSSLDLVQSFRLLGFLSVPLTGIGVFVFCWTRLTKVTPVFMRQILGIIAALFYVTSPLAWIWLTRWGFYSESISHPFVPWTLIFFDFYLDYLFNDSKSVFRRIFFALTVVFLVITTWVHIFSGLSVLPIFFVLGAYRFIISKEVKVLLFKRIIGPAIALGLAFLCLFSFRYFEFSNYYKFVADGGFRGYKSLKNTTYQELANNMLTTKMTLSLDEPVFDLTNPDPTDSFRSTIKELRYPFFVWILIIPTLLFGYFRSKKMFALSLYVVFGLYTSTSPNFMIFLGKLGPLSMLSNVLQGRIFFIPMRIIIPVVAAYGAYVMWDLLGAMLSKYIFTPIRVLIILILTIFCTLFVVYRFYNLPYARAKANIGSDNPIDLRDIWSKQGPKEREKIAPDSIFNSLSGYKTIIDQLQFSNWPKFKISKEIGIGDKNAPTIFDSLPQEKYRFDISGYAGSLVMSAPLVSNNSQIQMYINTLSLICNMWNYQTQVMYTRSPLYQKPNVLTEVSKWFGLDYAYLTGSTEPVDYWQQEGTWEQLTPNWWKFKESTGLVDVTNKPKILVISDLKRDFYDQTFRFFTKGGLSYDQGIPVMGAKEVDSYSLKELEKFDVIFMRGYDYKIKIKAYDLLDKYVKNGGKLIFDTGWQYNIPDWKISNAPSFMPFESLSWNNLSTTSSFEIQDQQIAGNVDGSKFGDLIWENISWGVSAPDKLRSWAKPVVSYDGKTLVAAGEYGKGKVVWIGFNIIPHSESKDNLEEVYLFNNLLKYLIGEKTINKYLVSEQDRPNPDMATFVINENTNEETSLMFKETYHPYWHAYVYNGSNKKEVPIFRAGPGFKLVTLPKMQAGDKVVFEIKKPLVNRLFDLLSILTGLVLIYYVVFSIKTNSFSQKIPNPFTFIYLFLKNIFRAIMGESDDNY